MRVSDAIAHLNELDPDEQIAIQWVTRKHVEDQISTPYPAGIWNDSVAIMEDEAVLFEEFHQQVSEQAKQSLDGSL